MTEAEGSKMKFTVILTPDLEDGGFVAECLTQDIFSQGNSWDELRSNVSEAVRGYFFDQPKPSSIRLHLVRDEILRVA